MNKEKKKLQGQWIAGILGSVLAVLGSAIYLGATQISRVLGVSDGLNHSSLVNSAIQSSLVGQIHSGYTGIIFIVFMAIGAMIIFQLVGIIKKLGSVKSYGLINILKIIVIDIVIFFLSVVGIGLFNEWNIQNDAPREMEYMWVAEDSVRITWQSKSPVMSQVLWGYSEMHLDNVTLGVLGEALGVEHEVLLEVEPNADVYFKILVDGVKFGQEGAMGYYYLPKIVQIQQSYPLKLKETARE